MYMRQEKGVCALELIDVHLLHVVGLYRVQLPAGDVQKAGVLVADEVGDPVVIAALS